ncbi:putative F-box protein At1g21990 isoform X2 [Raphanus sativus]|uniref:F-box protein At1g21990 isoform X2 n=1 Tax=Raphanus sativus TaxID=3726 RepID=A0A6J0N0V3_RAPSA|nr:putative F-box protein At1g21990 isoform X2 [Raphanus sativus]
MSVQLVSTDDSISSLPDDVLGKVLSLLPTNQAASTSVLSKRWRNLFHLVDSLYLSDDATRDPLGFPDLVEKTLSLFRNKIKTLSLRSKHKHYSYDWIYTVLLSSFTELHLESSVYHIIGIENLASNTLVKLTISHGFCLAGFGIPEMYGHLISDCPVLEELLVRYDPCSDFGCTVFSSSVAVLNPCVKRLTFSCPFRCYLDHILGQVFRTPGLVYLDYSSFVSRLYHVDHMSSLVEARLDILMEPLLDDDDSEDDGGDILPDVTNLVAGISNVKTLHLSSDSLEVFHLYCKSMPVFHKLLTLSFESHKERGWQVVPLLLNNSPNLETLVIKGLVHQVTSACVCTARKKKKKIMKGKVCCLSTCQVKVLKVLGYGGTKRELNQMKHFLGNLKCLETVKVGVKSLNRVEDNNVSKTCQRIINALNKDYHQRIINALTKLPRASSSCQIHFF